MSDASTGLGLNRLSNTNITERIVLTFLVTLVVLLAAILLFFERVENQALEAYTPEIEDRIGRFRRRVLDPLYQDNRDAFDKGEIAPKVLAQHVAQLIAAIAAGSAMLLSTVLAIWSQELYGINTFPFVVALVLGYMLKDRMKDWMRSYFSAKIGRWLYDRSAKIMDPLTGVMVGRCRESFNFVPAGQVPSLVWRRRHVRAEGAVETEHKRESVMRYVKHITLAGRRIDRQVVRASDITDIVRFDVSRFLVRMDDRKQRIPIYDPETDSVRTAKLNKRYHVNVVLVLRAADRNVLQMERYRFVLDKSGLKELQQDDEEGTVIIHAPDRSLLHILAAQRA